LLTLVYDSDAAVADLRSVCLGDARKEVTAGKLQTLNLLVVITPGVGYTSISSILVAERRPGKAGTFAPVHGRQAR
jgi:hypothetical protein